MARLFPLAGLLRLRRLQKDRAAGELAAVNSRLYENSARAARARSSLGATSADVTSTESLYALAAARASSRSMLEDLAALGEGHRVDAGRAQSVFDAARATAASLEKLEHRHTDVVAVEELHAEQIRLDEIAGTTWHRNRKGTAR